MAVSNRYFPHDSNAKDDPKCVLLIDEMGLEGYGIFWMLIEVLREQPEYSYPIANAMALARRYNTQPEQVDRVINNYGLFVVENDAIFFSESLRRRMLEAESIAQRRRNASQKANLTRWGKDANGIRTESERSPILSQYKNKSISKSKEKRDSIEKSAQRFSPPTLDEVKEYIIQNNARYVDAETFYDYYEAIGWKVGKNPMKDWRASVRGWNRREKKILPKLLLQQLIRKENGLYKYAL